MRERERKIQRKIEGQKARLKMYSFLFIRIIHVHVKLKPAIAHFKGLAKIMLDTEVFTIANM